MKSQHLQTAFAVVVLCIFVYFIHRLERNKETINSLVSITKEQNAEIQYRKTKEGRIIADKLAAEAKAEHFAEAYPKIAETLQKDFDIKIKNLKAYISAEFKAQGSGNSVVNNNYYIDSAGNKVPYFTIKAFDKYLDFSAKVYDSLNAPYVYTYSDTLQYVFHVKKKWFLGNEQLYGSGMLSNPNAKITNSTSVLIKDYRDKRFYLGAGMSYDINGNFVPSIQIGYSIYKF